jgi:hypothetical protein
MDLDADRGGDAPKWSGIKGVTGDASREAELGAGKWNTADDARSLDELRKQMDTAPVREMDIEPAGPRWELLGVVAVVVLLLVAWWVFQPFSSDEATPPPPESAAAQATEPAPAAAPAPAPAPAASPVSAKVTVTTTPPGARIRLDDRSYGRSPATVPVPRDDRVHQLCAEPEGGEPTCRDVTGAGLAAQDPYEITLGGGPMGGPPGN